MSRRTLAALFTLLVVGASCSGGNGTLDFPAPPPTGEPVPAGEDFFDFTAPRLGGGQVTGAELQGADVALWFWAPW